MATYTARANHRGIYYENRKEILMYGGLAYVEEMPASIVASWPTIVKGAVYDYFCFCGVYVCICGCVFTLYI